LAGVFFLLALAGVMVRKIPPHDSMSESVTQNEINLFKAFICENTLAKSWTMAIRGSNGVLTIFGPGANSPGKNLVFEVGTNQ